MASRNLELLLKIQADVNDAVAGLKRVEGEVDDLGDSGKKAEKELDGTTKSLRRLVKAAGAYVSIRMVAQLAATTDRLTQLQQRIKLNTSSVEEFNATFKALRDLSFETGAAIESTGAQFTRFKLAGDAIGATSQEIVSLVDLVQKLGAVSGASSAELQSAALQFSQALASGRLQGDELRSIMENLPQLAKALAEGLGVGVGQLRQLGADGELTAKTVLPALLSQAEKINEQFSKLPVSLERSVTNLNNALAVTLTNLEQQYGIIGKIAAEIDKVGRGIAGGSTFSIEGRIEELEKEKAVLDRIVETSRGWFHLQGRLNRALEQREEIELQILGYKRQQTEAAERAERAEQQAKVEARKRAALEQARGEALEANTLIFAEEVGTQIKAYDALLKRVEKARQEQKDFATAIAETREQLLGFQSGDVAPEDAGVLDIAALTGRAFQQLGSGDADAALQSAEKARALIAQMGEAGAESDLVLAGMLKRVEEVGLQAGQSLEQEAGAGAQALQDKLQGAVDELNKFSEAKIDLDTVDAEAAVASLTTSLKKLREDAAIPINITTTTKGPDADGIADSAAKSGAR